MFYHYSPKSKNAKTGPIPVTTSSRHTCPAACPFKGSGCYADGGPLRMHWDAVTKGARGGSWSDLVETIRGLPAGQLWRHNQAGDLPGDGVLIDAEKLSELADANRGRRGFTYTHYSMQFEQNRDAVRAANAAGFTVNLSANSIDEVDALAALDVGPVVAVLPEEADRSKYPEAPKYYKTAAGRTVAVCPATYRNTSCADCGLCATGSDFRSYVIGFPAHGSGKKKASTISRGRSLPVLSISGGSNV